MNISPIGTYLGGKTSASVLSYTITPNAGASITKVEEKVNGVVTRSVNTSATSHTFTIPTSTWNALSMYTDVNLEILVTDNTSKVWTFSKVIHKQLLTNASLTNISLGINSVYNRVKNFREQIAMMLGKPMTSTFHEIISDMNNFVKLETSVQTEAIAGSPFKKGDLVILTYKGKYFSYGNSFSSNKAIFSPDGKYLYTQWTSNNREECIFYKYDAEGINRTTIASPPEWNFSDVRIEFSRDSNYAVMCNYNNTVTIFKRTGDSFSVLTTLTVSCMSLCAKFSPVEDVLIVAGRMGSSSYSNVFTYTNDVFSNRGAISGVTKDIRNISFSPKGNYLSLFPESYSAMLLFKKNGAVFELVTQDLSSGSSFVVDHKEEFAYFSNLSGGFYYISLKTGQISLNNAVKVGNPTLTGIAINRTGNLLAYAHSNYVYFRSIAADGSLGKERYITNYYVSSKFDLIFSPKGTELIVTGSSNTGMQYQFEVRAEKKTMSDSSAADTSNTFATNVGIVNHDAQMNEKVLVNVIYAF